MSDKFIIIVNPGFAYSDQDAQILEENGFVALPSASDAKLDGYAKLVWDSAGLAHLECLWALEASGASERLLSALLVVDEFGVSRRLERPKS